MLQVAFEKSPSAFLAKCGDVLRQHPAEHNLILSLCEATEARLKKGEAPETGFATLYNDGEFVVAAVQSQQNNLVVSRAGEGDLTPLVQMLADQKTIFPGIVGPSDVAASFSNLWATITGRESVEYMDQIIYSLDHVTPQTKAEGECRLATPDEKKLIAGWMEEFCKISLPKAEQISEKQALARAEDRIKAGRVHVWSVKGKPVAMANISGTKDFARISLVYTPQELRGLGYASAVVSAATQKQLDGGAKACCLYADAKNPVSNSIYRKIGYEFVGRSSLYILAKDV